MASQHQGTHSRKKEAEHNGETHFHKNDLLHEALEEFKERGGDVKNLVQEFVQDKPFKALGIALVTGMAVALFLKR